MLWIEHIPGFKKIKICLLLGGSLFWSNSGWHMGTRTCVHHLSLKFWHQCTIRGFVKKRTDVFNLCAVSFKVFIPSQGQMRILHCVCRWLLKCVANHIINSYCCGQKADSCDPVPRLFLPEPALSFSSPPLRPFRPGHQDPNDVLDAQSISWQLQHLSPWESCPQRWLR